jgi:citrate synthase
VKDNRTGKSYEFPIHENGFIRSSDLGKIVHQGQVLRYYDPGYKNTMNCTSRITFIDGAKGIAISKHISHK